MTRRILRSLGAVRGFPGYLRRHMGEIWQGVIHLWWIFVIVMPLCGLVLYIGIDYTNTKWARQQERSNKQFRKSQIESNQKFQDAQRLSTKQTAYVINRLTCQTRVFIDKGIADTRKLLTTYQDAATDPTLTPSAQKRNRQRIVDTRRSIRGAVKFRGAYSTIPSDFKCSDLGKHPPKS